MSIKSIFDWIYRLIKGMFIGTGAILPGVSGGALAAVFGLYERIIAFLSNPRRDFWRNVLFLYRSRSALCWVWWLCRIRLITF